MAYQNNQKNDGVVNGSTATLVSSGSSMLFNPLSQTLRLPLSGANSVSMKDLRANKQATKALIQDSSATHSSNNLTIKSNKSKINLKFTKKIWIIIFGN